MTFSFKPKTLSGTLVRKDAIYLPVSSVAMKLFAALSALFSLLAIVTGCCPDWRAIIFALLLACSICLVAATRNNVILFMISFMIAYANYSACMVNTFPPYSGYDTLYSAMPVSAFGMALVLLFTASLLLFIPHEIKAAGDLGIFDRCKEVKYAGILVPVITLVLVVIFFTCSSGFTLGAAGRATNNSIFEYAYVLFIFGFMIAGKDKILRSMMLAVALLYLAQVFLGGNRASGLAIVFLLFVLYVAGKVTWIKILPFLLLGFLAMVTMGYFRGGDEFFLFKLFDAWVVLGDNAGVWDTASYAFHQSIAFLRLDDVVGMDEKLYLTRQWLMSWFVGSGVVPDSGLAPYCQALYPGMGGGFLPHYAYFYLGIPGVIAFAGVVAWLFKMIATMGEIRSDLNFCIALSVTVTCCRWYIYSPAPLTTGIVFISIAYLFIRLFIEKATPGNASNCYVTSEKRGSSRPCAR